ncbi:MAG: triple tyrosine motif-containing protein [Alistipes finegoldii]
MSKTRLWGRSITTMACDGDERQRHRAVAPAVESRNLLFGEQLPGRREKSVCLPDAGAFRTLVPAPRGQKAVQFFNLPAGSYVFEVKAANNDGLWGDEVSSLRFG